MTEFTTTYALLLGVILCVIIGTLCVAAVHVRYRRSDQDHDSNYYYYEDPRHDDDDTIDWWLGAMRESAADGDLAAYDLDLVNDNLPRRREYVTKLCVETIRRYQRFEQLMSDPDLNADAQRYLVGGEIHGLRVALAIIHGLEPATLTAEYSPVDTLIAQVRAAQGVPRTQPPATDHQPTLNH